MTKNSPNQTEKRLFLVQYSSRRWGERGPQGEKISLQPKRGGRRAEEGGTMVWR